MSLNVRLLPLFLLPVFATASFRIAGGTGINVAQAPFMVSILNPSTLELQCSGVIIHENFILTAAHCFYEKPEQGFGKSVFFAQLYVRVGSVFWNRGGVVYSTTAVSLAPRYGSDFLYFDLAIARLNDTLRFSRNIFSIALPRYRAPIAPNSIGVAIGYGITSSDLSNDQLQAVAMPVWSYQKCNDFIKNKAPEIYSPLLGKGTGCAGFTDQNKTACRGDAGGAFLIGNLLYGIISFGSSCGIAAPTYFTEVSQFEDMIDILERGHSYI